MERIRYLVASIIMLMMMTVNVHSGTGWLHLSPVTGHDLRNVRFIDQFTGWAAGDSGLIINTTNGGSAWTVSQNDHVFDLTSIAVTPSYVFIAGDSGYILRHMKGNPGWVLLKTGINVKLMSVFFLNDLTGYAAGLEGRIIKTTNGGTNWLHMNSGTEIQLNSIFFENESKGWTGGYGGIYHTTNSGSTWHPQFTDGLLNLNAIFFSDSVNGWSAYYDNPTFGPEIVRTTDAGSSWINHAMDNSYSLDLFFISRHTGWSACHFGKIMYSTDGGTNWTSQISGTGENLNSVFFIDSLNGWCVGNNGTILKTATGGIITGVTDPQITSHIPEMNFEIFQNYPNPFNSQTIVKYYLKDHSDVSVTVSDIYGREVFIRTISKETPGMHEVKLNGSELSSGVYYCRIKAELTTKTIKLILLK